MKQRLTVVLREWFLKQRFVKTLLKFYQKNQFRCYLSVLVILAVFCLFAGYYKNLFNNIFYWIYCLIGLIFVFFQIKNRKDTKNITRKLIIIISIVIFMFASFYLGEFSNFITLILEILGFVAIIIILEQLDKAEDDKNKK